MSEELVEELVRKAVGKVSTLQKGTTFQVSELFDKTEWSEFAQTIKMQIGARFYDKIKEKGLLDVVIRECDYRKRATIYHKVSK